MGTYGRRDEQLGVCLRDQQQALTEVLIGQPARGDHAMPLDLDTAWVLGRGYIRFFPLLN